MNSRKNLLLGLAAGAGVALGYWLNSKNGRAKTKEILDMANDWVEKGTDVAETYINDAASKATDVLDKGIQLAEQAKEVTSKDIHLKSKNKVASTNGASK